jgi:hypothetical protein
MALKNRKWFRIALRILVGLLVILVVAGVWNREKIYRLYKVNSLFNEADIVRNFVSMDRFFKFHMVKRSGPVYELGREQGRLPESYAFRGEERSLADYLTRSATTALLVARDGRIVFEEYYLGTKESDRRISWSVAKSFVSALVGIALAEGRIKSVMDPVTDYAPELKGSGYEGVPLKHVLQMSSGVKFNEDYMDFNSDINRMGRILALGGALDKFASEIVSERGSGTRRQYVSMDTHVIGMVLKRAVGMGLADYLAEKLWSKLGPEDDAIWLTDDHGMEFALGGLNMRTRDYARLGLLYLQQGMWNGEQVVPADWVRASVTPDAPHLQPGENPLSNTRLGYAYQWWIPENPDGEFMALGIYGQFIYVNTEAGLVIVKNSADRHFADNYYESDFEAVAVFRAIAGRK